MGSMLISEFEAKKDREVTKLEEQPSPTEGVQVEKMKLSSEHFGSSRAPDAGSRPRPTGCKARSPQ